MPSQVRTRTKNKTFFSGISKTTRRKTTCSRIPGEPWGTQGFQGESNVLRASVGRQQGLKLLQFFFTFKKQVTSLVYGKKYFHFLTNNKFEITLGRIVFLLW